MRTGVASESLLLLLETVCEEIQRGEWESAAVTDKFTGLDDGPSLPSAKKLKNAYAKIEQLEVRSDTQRINWLESKKFFEVGINFRDGKWAYEVRFNDNTLKRFFGRSLRSAIDAGMDAENSK